MSFPQDQDGARTGAGCRQGERGRVGWRVEAPPRFLSEERMGREAAESWCCRTQGRVTVNQCLRLSVSQSIFWVGELTRLCGSAERQAGCIWPLDVQARARRGFMTRVTLSSPPGPEGLRCAEGTGRPAGLGAQGGWSHI